jgi:hypothetical protein
MWLYSLIFVVPMRVPSDRWLTPIVGCTDTVQPIFAGARLEYTDTVCDWIRESLPADTKPTHNQAAV